MKTKNRIKNLRSISPDYPRIPHLDKSISAMTHDDIVTESKITFPLTAWVQEKVDGANLGVSWTSGPIVRNRNNILKKGYIETDTPAKLQFRPTWNWVHKHGADIRKLSELCYSPIAIYGEWMYATHSIYYDRLPDLFLAYDIYVVEDRKFLAPDVFEELMSQTDISYIKSVKHTLNSMQDVVELSESKSLYRNGLSEGIVIKLAEGRWQTDSFKVVNRFFERRDNFNSELLKNKIKM